MTRSFVGLRLSPITSLVRSHHKIFKLLKTVFCKELCSAQDYLRERKSFFKKK